MPLCALKRERPGSHSTLTWSVFTPCSHDFLSSYFVMTTQLEKAYENRGEPSQGIKEIQSTIALFDMHNVGAKIMISAFSDLRKVLAFPGAHGFSVTKEQIVSARLPTSRSRRIPLQSASSLPQYAIDRAKAEKWPPQFFDAPEAGGSNGSFVRCFPSRLETTVFTIQRDLFHDAWPAIREFLIIVRDEVVHYRILMMQLVNPQTGSQTLARESAQRLKEILYSERDLRRAEIKWNKTLAARFVQSVEWVPTGADKCDVWLASDGTIVAQVPERWDRRGIPSMNIYAEF
jgi:hypothetical protein